MPSSIFTAASIFTFIQADDKITEEDHIQEIESCLNFPQPIIRNQRENPLIFNFVKIDEPVGIVKADFKSGGTAILSLMKVRLSYGRVGANGQFLPQPGPPLEKLIVVKKPKGKEF